MLVFGKEMLLQKKKIIAAFHNFSILIFARTSQNPVLFSIISSLYSLPPESQTNSVTFNICYLYIIMRQKYTKKLHSVSDRLHISFCQKRTKKH